MKKISPEFQLLLEVSQTSVSEEKLISLFTRDIRQHYLFDLAIANGILPLLCRELQKIKEISLADDFAHEQKRIANQNFLMSARLLQIIYSLKEKGIEVIPLKGPLLGQHAYKDISLRPFSDLDILVQEHELVSLADALFSLGYKSAEDPRSLTHPFVLEKFSDITFEHPDTGTLVELHWKLLQTASATLSDIPSLFKNSINIPFQNMQLSSLPLEEEFLYLCVHAAKHRFERLEWINDLNHLFNLHHTSYDWERILRMAKNEAFLTPYLLALALLKILYHKEVPHSQSQSLIQTEKINKLCQKVLNLHADDYVLKAKKKGIRWMELRFAISLEDTVLRKLRLIVSPIFSLYKNDILAARELPQSLSFLYYLYRFKRIVQTLCKKK